ncbi:MAG: hypothetical protein FJ291_01185 [Planctomycetes bacterium]|nr:hypothetical protein [Planctomycetota bacterium]
MTIKKPALALVLAGVIVSAIVLVYSLSSRRAQREALRDASQTARGARHPDLMPSRTRTWVEAKSRLVVDALFDKPLTERAAREYADHVFSFTFRPDGKSVTPDVHKAILEAGGSFCSRVQVQFYTDPWFFEEAFSSGERLSLTETWKNTRDGSVFVGAALPKTLQLTDRTAAAAIFATLGLPEKIECEDLETGLFRMTALAASDKAEAHEIASSLVNTMGWGTRWEGVLQAFPELRRVHFIVPTRKGPSLHGYLDRDGVYGIWRMGKRYHDRYKTYLDRRLDIEDAHSRQGKLTEREAGEALGRLSIEEREFLNDLWGEAKEFMQDVQWK